MTNTDTVALEELRRELRHLRDREAIRDAVQRHARGYDRRDRDYMASAYWPDAQVNYGAQYSGEPDGMIEWGIDIVKERTVTRLHHMTTHTVEIEGDTAHAESYVIWTMLSPEKTLILGTGRYIDRLERRGDEWRIAVREFHAEVGATVTSSSDPAAVESRQDPGDLSYVRPLPRRPETK